MSTVKLNVWITEFGDACHIVKPHPEDPGWFVHITDCTGNPLVWCDKTYTFLQAKCGHLEVEIPPGCYTVFASHTPRAEGSDPGTGAQQTFGNRLTHIQVVRANCGDHVCVTLFSPTGWSCGSWFASAVNAQIRTLTPAQRELGAAAAKAVEAFVAKLPADPFGANVTRIIQQAPPKTGEGGEGGGGGGPKTGGGGGPKTPVEPYRPEGGPG
jgi:hypothetical protein